MCFVWISEQTAIISLYNINWLVCITETVCVYCAVRTECWHTVWASCFPMLHGYSPQSTSHFTCRSSTFLPLYLYQKDERALPGTFRVEDFLIPHPVITMTVLPFNAPSTPPLALSLSSLDIFRSEFLTRKQIKWILTMCICKHLTVAAQPPRSPDFIPLHFHLPDTNTTTFSRYWKWREISTNAILVLSNN
jgi:hypothetical protein